MQPIIQQVNLENQQLQQILAKQNITASQFLSIKDIVKKVKSRIRAFVSYCSQHNGFLIQIINLTIKTPIHETADLNLRNIVNSGLQILNGDIEQILDLLILNENDEQYFRKIINNENTDLTDFKQSTETSEQSQNSQSDKTQSFLQKFNHSYRFVLELISYIEIAQINDVCLNYMTSIINTLIRRKPHQILDFFYFRKDLLNKLLDLGYKSGVWNMLVKLIAEEDHKNLQHHCFVRDTIMDGIIKKLQQTISNKDQFLGYLQFVQQAFNSNRSSYSDGIENFKENGNKLTSKQIIHYFIEGVKQDDDFVKMQNCLMYLLMVVRRMGVDEDTDRDNEFDSSTINKVYKPTMEFKVDELYNSLSELILKTTSHILKWSKSTKMSFFELLYLMTKHKVFQDYKYNYVQMVQQLLIIFSQETDDKGLNKFYLQALIENLMSRVSKISDVDINKLVEILQSIVKASNYKHQDNLQKLNSQEQRPFLCKLLLLFDNYSQQFSKTFLKLDFIRDSYRVKLSNISPPNHKYSQFPFLNKPQTTIQQVPRQSNDSNQYLQQSIQIKMEQEEVKVVSAEDINKIFQQNSIKISNNEVIKVKQQIQIDKSQQDKDNKIEKSRNQQKPVQETKKITLKAQKCQEQVKYYLPYRILF